MTEDDQEEWITAVEAAEICGMTKDAFRRAVYRQPLLKDARKMYGPTFALFNRDKITEWSSTRPRRRPRK